LFDGSEIIACPDNYNDIAGGCYKLMLGVKMTWFDARQYCLEDSLGLPDNVTNEVANHLVALENVLEKNALFFWMRGSY
jgi:hypothetical protein